MPDPRPDDHNAAHQFERLVFFSDAVFAIAITVLVLDLRLPRDQDVIEGLKLIFPKLFGFALSFFVISIYWIAHHRLFGTLRREDSRLRVANFAFLASVVFLPFPTSVIAERPADTASVMLYAFSVAAVGLLLVCLALVARRPALMRAGETKGGTLHVVIRSLGAPTVFLASSVLALRSPRGAELSWLALWPVIAGFERLGRRVDRASARREA